MSSPATAPARPLTVDDIKPRLGLRQPSSVIKLIKTRGLPARRIGRRYVIDPAEFERWLSQQAVNSDGDGDDEHTAETGTPGADPEWVAEQVAKFSPDDLRRAGELLLALASTAAASASAA